MEWLKVLGDLSPTALLVAAIWIIAHFIIAPMLRSHKDTIERLSKTQEVAAETMKEGIDANTEAVKESVKHTETIITNHLSGQAGRDQAMIAEMHAMTTVIDDMNHRRRETDR